MKEDAISVKGVSYESLALDVSVPYPLPLVKFARDKASMDYWWRLLNFGLRLPSPYGFPELAALPDRNVLDRYCDEAKDLAASSCLAYPANLSITINRLANGEQQEVINADFPDVESVRGLLVLFRQFYAPEEPASFVKVKSSLMRAAKNSPPAEESHLNILKSWGRAHGRLRTLSAKALVGQRLIEEGLLFGPVPEKTSPELIISAFAYGDHIHWGKHREQVAKWRLDSFLGPWNQLAFLEAVSGLAHFYMGYAVIASKALGREDLIEKEGDFLPDR